MSWTHPWRGRARGASWPLDTVLRRRIMWTVATEYELLDAWRAGQDDAGSVLLERLFKRLYRFFRTKVDDGVDDLIQRTLLSCVESRDRVKNPASFRAYLFRMARNELYDHYKRRAKQPEAAGTSRAADPGPDPVELIAGAQRNKLLLHALRRLPLELQVILSLHYWEGMTHTELAAVLELPSGTTKSRVRRAREALRAHLMALDAGEEDVASTLTTLDSWAVDVRDQVDSDEA